MLKSNFTFVQNGTELYGANKAQILHLSKIRQNLHYSMIKGVLKGMHFAFINWIVLVSWVGKSGRVPSIIVADGRNYAGAG